MIAPYYDALRLLVFILRPKYVLELGTGRGHSGAAIMERLSGTSRFTTINLGNPPSGDDVGAELAPWRDDPRLRQIIGDTRQVRELVDPGVDLLFIDSGAEHIYSLISEEWRLYRSVLVDGAIVCCDDILANDMSTFWGELHYEKVLLERLNASGFGVFRYCL